MKGSPVLIIPRLNIQKEIKENLSWLDQNQICSLEPITDKTNTVLLFGHNRWDTFHFLFNIEKGDLIFIKQGNIKFKYVVDKIQLISIQNKEYLEMGPDILRMFTCTKNTEERFMVTARRI